MDTDLDGTFTEAEPRPLDTHALGRRIATLRRRHGWTQRRLAEAAGVSNGYIALLELGRMPSPGKFRLDAVARALGLRTADALLGHSARKTTRGATRSTPADAADANDTRAALGGEAAAGGVTAVAGVGPWPIGEDAASQRGATAGSTGSLGNSAESASAPDRSAWIGSDMASSDQVSSTETASASVRWGRVSSGAAASDFQASSAEAASTPDQKRRIGPDDGSGDVLASAEHTGAREGTVPDAGSDQTHSSSSAPEGAGTLTGIARAQTQSSSIGQAGAGVLADTGGGTGADTGMLRARTNSSITDERGIGDPLERASGGAGVRNVAGTIDQVRSVGARQLPVFRWGSCGDPRDRESPPDPDRLEYPPPGRESLIGSNGFGVVVKGESMAARGIHDGDVVWVNPERAYAVGKVVLALASDVGGEGGMVVKTYARTEVGDCLVSETENGRSPLVCREFKVIGPVVGITSWRLPS